MNSTHDVLGVCDKSLHRFAGVNLHSKESFLNKPVLRAQLGPNPQPVDVLASLAENTGEATS